MILKFYKKHKEWFSLFTSAFAGTLLGIGISLVLSTYDERKHQETASLRCIVMALDELRQRSNTIEKIYNDEMYTSDSIFQELLEYAPNHFDEMPQELIDKFDSKLHDFKNQLKLNMTEQIVLNNIKVIEVFEDLSIIRDLHVLFGITKVVEKEQQEATDDIRRIIKDYCKREDYYHNSIDHAFIKKLFQDPELYYSLYRYHETTCFVSSWIEVIKQQIAQLEQNLEINSTKFSIIQRSNLKSTEVSSED